MKSLPMDLSPQQMLAGLSEFGPIVPIPENEERMQRRTFSRGIAHLILNNLISAVKSGRRGRGTSENVARFYEGTYGAASIVDIVKQFGCVEKPRLFRLGTHSVVKVGPSTVVRFMRKCLGDIVSACEPENICEVGCGRGGNLFYLANKLPTARCAGFDISENAIKSAIALQRMDNLPSTKFGKALDLAEDHVENVKKINFCVGSAFSLPSADQSFDLVYTSRALEQMHTNIDKALSELRRVARCHVLMMEPFADGNDFLGRTFLWSKNYFRMRAAVLPKYGLAPIRVWTDFPRKQSFGFSFVLCRVKA